MSAELFAAMALGPFVYFCARPFLVQPAQDASPFVLNWWAALCGLSATNLALWLVAYRAFGLRGGAPARRWHLLLSAIYAVGCAQRSIWPKVDVQRFVLADTWLSSVFVGRSIATVAEVCFAAQWALLLREYSRDANFRFGELFSWAIVPMLATAQLCCWYSVLSTSFLGHVFEESLWTATALLLTFCVGVLWRNAQSQRGFLGTVLAFGMGYVLYMVTMDVPMYLFRWIADERAGRVYLGVAAGLHDVATRWVVTYRWEDWQSEISWLSLYFSLAVWASIGCAHAPRYEKMR